MININDYCLCLVRKPNTFYSKDADFNDGETIPLKPGERIRLKCNFKGNPRPDIVWYKNEKKISLSKASEQKQGRSHIKIRNKRCVNS